MIDLHMHSHYSDGSLSPPQLIDFIFEQGIRAFALTDHDTVAGTAEAIKLAQAKEGLCCYSGVELSVKWKNKDIHVVGVGFDYHSPHLTGVLAKQQQAREKRAELIGERLDALGMKDTLLKAKKLASHGVVTRPHFASVLVREGFCKDMQAAFSQYLKRGRKAYVTTQWITLEEALFVIHAAGGLSILAHPMRYKLTRSKLNELLQEFKALGGVAAEVISGVTMESEIMSLLALCNQYDLLASIGSDFHGPEVTPRSMAALVKWQKKYHDIAGMLHHRLRERIHMEKIQ